jgi:hypothetical protein
VGGRAKYLFQFQHIFEVCIVGGIWRVDRMGENDYVQNFGGEIYSGTTFFEDRKGIREYH